MICQGPNVPNEGATREKRPDVRAVRQRTRTLISLALLAACCASFSATIALNARVPATGRAARFAFAFRSIAPATAASPKQNAGADFSKFSHSSAGHAARACSACHARENNSPRPSLPGHKACADCHVQQFVTAGS